VPCLTTQGSGPEGRRGFENVVVEGNGGGGSTVTVFFLQEEILIAKRNETNQSRLIMGIFQMLVR
jgi:hypothetical protein